jgi:hypothetical protein
VTKFRGIGGYDGSGPACYGSTVGSKQTSPEIKNRQHTQRSDQHFLARQKRYVHKTFCMLSIDTTLHICTNCGHKLCSEIILNYFVRKNVFFVIFTSK